MLFAVVAAGAVANTCTVLIQLAHVFCVCRARARCVFFDICFLFRVVWYRNPVAGYVQLYMYTIIKMMYISMLD